MSIQILVADEKQHAAQIKELFWEYLQWANSRASEEFNVNFDSAATIERDMKGLAKFMPPNGRLLLCYAGNGLAGIACLKHLTPSIGEIKRIYVRPGNRKFGLGRTLVNRLLQEAQNIGYQLVRLDSASFMKEAHQLYQSIGFKIIDAYEGSEIPKEFHRHWVFMEIPLHANSGYEMPRVAT